MYCKLIFVSICLLLSACSSTARKPLMTSIAQKPIKVFSLVDQTSLDTLIFKRPFSGAIITDIAVELDNQSKVERAEKAIMPITSKLPRDIYSTSMKSALEAILLNEPRAKFSSVQTINDEDELDAFLKKGERYLLVDSTFMMDFDYRTFVIKSDVLLKDFGYRKSLYENQFEYSGTTLPDVYRTQEEMKSAVSSLKKEFHALGKYKKGSRKVVKYYKKQIKLVNQEDYKGIFLVNKRIDMWATEYLPNLNTDFKQGTDDIVSLLFADLNGGDIIESTIHLTKQKLVNEAFLPHRANERELIRFTSGNRIGALCSKPKVKTSDKELCLANNIIEPQILRKWSLSKLKPF